MKKLNFIIASIIISVSACNNAPKADEGVTGSKETVVATGGTAYTVDTTSVVNWTGSKPTRQHQGTFKLRDGALMVQDNALTGGKFTIDMASLKNIDMATDIENKNKLEGHLKSPDFFDVSKYPTATFEIISVSPFKADSSKKDLIFRDATHTIKGNLTLKDSTKSISFPAKVTVDAKTAAASADFNIDRTQWGINYKGPNNPQDWVISKTVNIKLSISATRK